MDTPNENVCNWNLRGLNSRARRDLLRDTVRDEHASLICVQETKLAAIDDSLILQMFGPGFDFFFLPAAGTRGGILVAWRTSIWEVDGVAFHSFAISVRIKQCCDPSPPWWLSVVYGPFSTPDRMKFFQELRTFRANHPGPWALTGDFNLIYQAEDKNNQNLDRR
jgi:exonuclease III